MVGTVMATAEKKSRIAVTARRCCRNLLEISRSPQGRNANWLFMDHFLRLAGGFIVAALVARHLGPSGFGTLIIAVAFSSLFTAAVGLGIENVVIRELSSKSHPEPRMLLATVFRLKLGVSVLALLAAGGLAALINLEPVTAKAVWILVGASIFQVCDPLDYWFQSNTNSKHVVVTRMIGFISSSVLKIVLVMTGGDIVDFALASAVEPAITALFMFGVFRRQHGPIDYSGFDRELAWSLLRQGAPLLLAFFAYISYSRLDQLLIAAILNETQAGLYAAALRINEIPVTLVSIIAASYFPKLAKLYATDRDGFFRLYSIISRSLTFAGLLFAAGVFVSGAFFIELVFGQDYRKAGEVLAIQSIGALFMMNAGLRSSFMVLAGQQNLMMKITLASAGLNVLLVVSMTSWLGLSGAAIAYALTQFVSLFLSGSCFSPLRPILAIQADAFTFGLAGIGRRLS